MLGNKWVTVVLFGLVILFAATSARRKREVAELKETVDFLNTPENELVIVVNENLKSKQERTRDKIKDIIAINRYPSLSSYELDNLARIVVKYSERYSVPVNLVLGVITAESVFNRQAVSAVGALGPMQVMPGTAVNIASELRVSSFDPFAWDDGVRFGTYYLRKMLRTFDGDVELAIRAYNTGAENVSKGYYPSETIAYHKSVMSVYQWLETRRLQCDTSD